MAESPWMKTAVVRKKPPFFASRESAVVVREPKLKVDLTKYVEDRDDLVAEVPRFHCTRLGNTMKYIWINTY